MKTTGVFTIDPWTLLDDSSMKTELLYFDHLKYFIRGKDVLEKFCNSHPKWKETFDNRMKEIETLEKTGLISEYSIQQFDKDYSKYKDDRTIQLAWKRFELANEFLKTKGKDFKDVFVDFLERFREVGQLEARTNAIILNKLSEDEFIPIIRGNYHNNKEDIYLKKANVLSVIIRHFPKVAHDISTDRLVELKSDEEANIKLHRLKNWTSEITNSKLTEKEINQKVEYLLIEYKKQLELHKLKYDTGIIETFVTVGLEVLENIITLNLSKAAKVFFDIQKKELTLLEAEEKLIGKEVAYLHHLDKNHL